MAGAKKGRKKGKRVDLQMVHRLAAGVSLLAFGVIVAAGIRAEASIVTITFRAALVVIVVGLISRIVMSILVTTEEMNSGKA